MTSTHIPGKGDFLDREVAKFFFEAGLRDLARNGGRPESTPPRLRAAFDALRMSVQELDREREMSASGHVSGPVADMAPTSSHGLLLPTKAMADRLRVGTRHARRLAAEAGIEPAARGSWHSEDVDELVRIRRSR